MNKAIVTISSGDYFERMAAITHPTIKAYADRIGADFIVWSDISGYEIPEYKKMEIGTLLDRYERVLYIDTDVIVRDDAPDIFDVVPADCLGMLEESRYYDRATPMLRFMRRNGFDSQLWDGKYYNAGIFVCSSAHRSLFARPPVEWNDFRDQTYVNTLIATRQAKVFPLPYRFNRVLGMDRVYGEDRRDSYFLHYAGVRVVLSEEETLDLIASDLETWRQFKPHYRFADNIAIVVEGDLAQQVAAEPVVRYARDVVYRGDNLVIATNAPDAFRHLGLPVYESTDQIPNLGKYHCRFTRGDPKSKAWKKLARHQVHVTQLAALLALGVELPLAQRRPALVVDESALARVKALAQPHALGDLVLVHPGHGAAPDTFPADVWQSYVAALASAGFMVAVIGQCGNDGLGVVEFDRSNTIDLVGRLSVAELIALVSQARILISNDSAPVQVAAAFDHWIGLIPGARNPEYVLPWRQGQQSWRATVLERKGLYHDYLHCPSGSRQPPLDACQAERQRECLPTADRIAQFVKTASAEAAGVATRP